MSTVVDATAFLDPLPQRRVRRPVRLILTDDAYPLEPTPEQAWLPVAFRAFEQARGRLAVDDVLIVGTGNGLDVLGAIEIFDPRSITATDLHAAGVAVARENVLAHLEDPDAVRLEFLAGDVLAPVPAGRRYSFVYENLPNLPAAGAADLRRGTLAGRFFDAGALEVPAPFGAYRLALHHRCLIDARPILRDGAGVLTAIGGRVPRDVAFALHRACGYDPWLAAFDVKLQVEPQLVVGPYRDAEEETGLPFTFLAPEAIGLVAAARRDGLEGQELADAVEPRLASLTMSAGEAACRVERGEPVAHSVLMIVGVLNRS